MLLNDNTRVDLRIVPRTQCILCYICVAVVGVCNMAVGLDTSITQLLLSHLLRDISGLWDSSPRPFGFAMKFFPQHLAFRLPFPHSQIMDPQSAAF